MWVFTISMGDFTIPDGIYNFIAHALIPPALVAQQCVLDVSFPIRDEVCNEQSRILQRTFKSLNSESE
jgi:hypothetical protein